MDPPAVEVDHRGAKIGSGPFAATYFRRKPSSPLPLKSMLTASRWGPRSAVASGVMYPFVTKLANRPADFASLMMSSAYSMKIVGSL